MPRLIEQPSVVEPAGNKPKRIEEYAGRVNSGHGAVSVARMRSPGGWQEPGRRRFDAGSRPPVRVLPLAVALALAGCAAPAPPPDGAAPAPCPAGAAGPRAEEGWRLVRAEGFTFCVPAHWRPVGEPAAAGVDAASWSGVGGTVAWGTGDYRPPDRGILTVEVRADDPRPAAPGEVRRFSESIGGVSADLWHDRVGERHFTGAQWTRPRAVHLSGEARDARGAALQLDVYRTVRFPRR